MRITPTTTGTPTRTPWLTSDAAVEYLGLPSRAALYKRVERGQVPAHRFGRQYRFHRSDLDRVILSSGPVSAVAEEKLG